MPSLMQRAVAMRKSLPAPVRGLLDRSLSADRGPVAWLQERLFVRGSIPAALAAKTELPVRLLIAPLNYAGQGREWARTVGADVEAVCMQIDFGGEFRFTADAQVPATVYSASRRWRRQQQDALGTFTHVIIESFASPVGRGTGSAVLSDVAVLRGKGVSVALLCHGTDVRSPSAHAERHTFSPFQPGYPDLDYLEHSVRANLRVVSEFSGPIFVSTPDLLIDVPGAQWLPVVVEPGRWKTDARVDRERPVVLHVPSVAAVKGTVHVTAAAEVLEADGLIEFRPLRGVPSAEMPSRVAEADIVVDQLLIGSYGVAACEAMAAGRVVVGNVDEQVRFAVRAATGLEVPIVQADPETILDVIRRLAADPTERARAAVAGPRFVDAVHAGRMTPDVLEAFLRRSAPEAS